MSDSKATTSDPGKLARSATGIPVIPVLDGFRGLAVMAIVVFHLLPTSGLLARLPDSALTDMAVGALPRMIDVLFIISGFVLFMPTIAQRGRFGDVVAYAIRRAARILPTYYLVLVVVALLLFFVPAIGLPVPTPFELGMHVTMLQSPFRLADPGFPIGLGLDGALWTISTLVCFYIVLPVIAKPYYRHPLLGLLIAGAITVLWREVVDQQILPLGPNGASVQLPYWAWHLGLGMTAAWAYYRLHEGGLIERFRSWAPYLQAFALAGMLLVLYARPAPFHDELLAAVVASSRSLAVAIAFPALLTLFILATAEAPRLARAGLDSRPARTLGDASYGVYMIHLPIALVAVHLSLLPDNPSPWRIPVEFGAVIALSILFGWLAFQYVERPIRLRARAWAYRRSRSAPTAEVAGAPAPGPAAIVSPATLPSSAAAGDGDDAGRAAGEAHPSPEPRPSGAT